MRWHLQPIAFLARGYPDAAGPTGQACFDKADPYTAITTIQMLGNGKANIQGMKGEVGDTLRRNDYQDLLNTLREEEGVNKVLAVRDREDVDYDTAPVPLE